MSLILWVAAEALHVLMDFTRSYLVHTIPNHHELRLKIYFVNLSPQWGLGIPLNLHQIPPKSVSMDKSRGYLINANTFTIIIGMWFDHSCFEYNIFKEAVVTLFYCRFVMNTYSSGFEVMAKQVPCIVH